jgi:SAM-dependent methyltransferase
MDDLSTREVSASYEPTRCDLCGSRDARALLQVDGRSMTSDSRVVNLDIEKIECQRCGLVRSGRAFSAEDLAAHYASSYVLATQADVAEPLLPDGDELVPRSQIFCEWIVDALRDAGVPEPPSLLEVGCGEGRLLRRMADHWPGARAHGLELSATAVEAARQRGLAVDVGGFEAIAGAHDVVYAVAVLEHLPSPRAFFARAAAALSDRGVLVVSQPVQDGPSADIFFVDHFWHFAAAHVEALAATAGLVTAARVGCAAVPTFSLHVLARGSTAAAAPAWPAAHAVRHALAWWHATFNRLDAWLDARDRRPLAVWGVGQTFDLLLAYTKLATAEIAVGIEDNLARFPTGTRPFPVVSPDTAIRTLDDPDVLLTFAPPPRVQGLLDDARLRWFAPLDDHAR